MRSGPAKLHLYGKDWVFWKPRTGRQTSIIDLNPAPILILSSQWCCSVALWPARARCHCLFLGSNGTPCVDIYTVQNPELGGFPCRDLKPPWKSCSVQMLLLFCFHVEVSYKLRSVPLKLESEPELLHWRWGHCPAASTMAPQCQLPRELPRHRQGVIPVLGTATGLLIWQCSSAPAAFDK